MSRLLGATRVAAVDPAAPLHRFQADGDDAPARLVPGARLFMQVIEPLIDGGVRARVVNGSAEHRLPFEAKTGARLHVLVAGTEARPTFVLLPGAADGADATLSQAARVLAALTPGRDLATRPPVVRSAMALAPGATIDVPSLSRALADALARSGLFYEAHQAQWVSGTREREALLDEPQAKLTLRMLPGERDTERADMLPVHRDGEARGAEIRPPGRELEGVVHRDTVALVQQQLAALETGAVVWRGLAWRGQALEWTVQREGSAHDTDGGDENYGRWHTRLRLTLPQLGTVDAMLGLDARGLDVRIAAADPGAADVLRSASAALAGALGAAGLNVRRVEVQRDR